MLNPAPGWIKRIEEIEEHACRAERLPVQGKPLSEGLRRLKALYEQQLACDRTDALLDGHNDQLDEELVGIYMQQGLSSEDALARVKSERPRSDTMDAQPAAYRALAAHYAGLAAGANNALAESYRMLQSRYEAVADECESYNQRNAAELESMLAQGVDKETAKRWVERPELRLFAVIEKLEALL